MDFEKLKISLKETGISPEQIDETIKKLQKKEEEEMKKLNEIYSVRDAIIYLKVDLGGKWNEAKIRRLIRENQIKPMENLGDARKLGYKIHEKELARFVNEQKMTKEDWKQRALAAEQRIKELEEAMEASKANEEEVLEVPEGQTSIDDYSEVSEVGKEEKNENLTASTALKSDLKLDEVKITHVKAVKEIAKGQYEFGFKLNGEDFKGQLQIDLGIPVLVKVESENGIHNFVATNKEELPQLKKISEVLISKVQRKIEKQK